MSYERCLDPADDPEQRRARFGPTGRLEQLDLFSESARDTSSVPSIEEVQADVRETVERVNARKENDEQ